MKKIIIILLSPVLWAMNLSAQSSGAANGHQYVDLGLPSGLLWATCNVGADSPSDCGDYFAWGETTPKSSYTKENSMTFGKILSDICGDSRYDAARANWGGDWRMPTKAQFQELRNHCVWTWTRQDGHEGYLVTSAKNGNSIFLPAGGRIESSSNGLEEYQICLWTSVADGDYKSEGFKTPSTTCIFTNVDRQFGLNIRPVMTSEKDDDEVMIGRKPYVTNRMIIYTSIDGEPVVPKGTTFGTKILYNKFIDGYGVIRFEGDVTSIPEGAFSGNKRLMSIELPESIRSIGAGAFDGCTALQHVSYKCSPSLFRRQFSDCESLESFDGEGVSEDHRCIIVNGTLIAAAVKHEDASYLVYNIPDYVTEIGSYAFKGRKSLYGIIIPDSVSDIGYMAFADCTNLHSSHSQFGKGLKSIYSYAFADCESLEEIELPSGLTTLGSYAFQDCHYLNTVKLPDSISSIENNTFDGCHRLSTIHLPDKLSKIGNNAFHYCQSLSKIDLPNSLQSIGSGAFAHCSSLTGIKLPASLIHIGEYAFSCTALKKINIPPTIRSIGKETFRATDFKDLIVPENVESISDKAFYSDSLERVTLPESIRFISKAFYSSKPNLHIYIKSKVPPTICDDSFGESRRGKLRYSFKHDDWIYEIEHDKSIRIYVPKESVMEYKKAWKQYGYHKHIYGY